MHEQHFISRLMIYSITKLKDNFEEMPMWVKEILRNNELNSICCEMSTCIKHNTHACTLTVKSAFNQCQRWGWDEDSDAPAKVSEIVKMQMSFYGSFTCFGAIKKRGSEKELFLQPLQIVHNHDCANNGGKDVLGREMENNTRDDCKIQCELKKSVLEFSEK